VRHRLSEYEEPADRQSDDQGDCGEPKKRRGKLQKPDHEYQLADWPTGRRVGGSDGTVRGHNRAFYANHASPSVAVSAASLSLDIGV
jgi:hypothetical protein